MHQTIDPAERNDVVIGIAATSHWSHSQGALRSPVRILRRPSSICPTITAYHPRNRQCVRCPRRALGNPWCSK